jgi:hypothetical protein
MVREVRSRLNSDSSRADQGNYGGHLSHYTGKGITPAALRRDQREAEPKVEMQGNPEFRITPPVTPRQDSRRR